MSNQEPQAAAAAPDAKPQATQPPTEPKRSNRGFASMTPERRRELGKAGGKAATENGRAHRFTTETASVAGKIPHERGTAHHWDAEEARLAGKKGGNSPKKMRNTNLHIHQEPIGSDPISISISTDEAE